MSIPAQNIIILLLWGVPTLAFLGFATWYVGSGR